MNLPDVPFAFPNVTSQRVFVLGLGGGCDILTAFALARLLDAGPTGVVSYGNTKKGDAGAIEPISPHILRVTGPLVEAGRRVRGRGKAWLDHAVPRTADGSPFIVLLDSEDAERELVGELRSLAFDLIVGVDTGGDSVAVKRGRGRFGRDQRMLAVLRATHVPLLHVVVAPGSDGEADAEDIQTAFAARAAVGEFRGRFSLGPMLPTYEAFRECLSPERTPRIVLAAFKGELARTDDGRLIVPRGRKPKVPAEWLTTGFVFAAS